MRALTVFFQISESISDTKAWSSSCREKSTTTIIKNARYVVLETWSLLMLRSNKSWALREGVLLFSCRKIDLLILGDNSSLFLTQYR